MKVFISWSGERSRIIAEYLADWIPNVLQEIQPWTSGHNIAAGAHWGVELSRSLADCKFGVICLTPGNLDEPWILFEAGSLAKQFTSARVVPFRTEVSAAEVKFPLAQFQGVDSDVEGTWKLVRSLNAETTAPLTEDRLRIVFDKFWPDLARNLSNVRDGSEAPTSSSRGDREILEELLYIAREQYGDRSYTGIDSRARRIGVEAMILWHEEILTHNRAVDMSGKLADLGIPSYLLEHQNPERPDSLFIGALVGVEDARAVIALVPYEVEFLFRPDYPTAEGGDRAGLTIGIGYISSHYEEGRGRTSEPVPVSQEVLRDLVAPGISNTEFQRRLRSLTWKGDVWDAY